MTTDTHTGQEIAFAPTDTSSPQEFDAQRIGRDLFYHRSLYRPYMSSFETNPMTQVTWDVYLRPSHINRYVALLMPELTPDIDYVPKDHKGEPLDEEFKYLARPVSRTLKEYETSEIHDFREAGVTMDLERAEELCRKMMEK